MADHAQEVQGRRLTGRLPWAVLVAAAVVTVLYLSTLQTDVNGSTHPYITDVGEIQNALPRWGTLHFTGYPLYAMTGSTLVTGLRALGIGPAASASAVSLLWGVLTVAVIVLLATEIGAPSSAALVGGLAYGVSLSAWVDASAAEVHSLTMLLTALTVWFAVRYARVGRPADLYALTLVFAQGVLHMRAVALLLPAVAVLTAPRWRAIAARLPAILAIAGLSCLVYAYMPLREQMGADWTFGQTSTWRGFREMVLDTKAERIIRPAAGAAEWLTRARLAVGLAARDLPWPFLLVGISGLLAVPWLRAPRRGSAAWRETAGLTLVWLPYVLLATVIWEGRVSDALLAVQLPVALCAGLGLAVWIGVLLSRRRSVGLAALAVAVVGLALVGARNRATVLAVTRERAFDHLRRATRLLEGSDHAELMMALWGDSYWTLAYAKGFEGALADVELVDHNADFAALVAEHGYVVAPTDTLRVLGADWWAGRLGGVALESYGPGLVAVRSNARRDADAVVGWPQGGTAGAPAADRNEPFLVNDDLALAAADVRELPYGGRALTLEWVATRPPERDYSVAVHVLDAGGAVLSQADRAHPVEGWWPTSRWLSGHRVRDSYDLGDVGSATTVRITAHYRDEDGTFRNGAWLEVPLRDR